MRELLGDFGMYCRDELSDNSERMHCSDCMPDTSKVLLLEDLLAEEDSFVSLTEEDYTAILRFVLREYRTAAAAFQQEKQDAVDYYTTWVHQVKTPIAAMKLILQAEDTEEHRQLLAELFRMEQYVEMVLMYLWLDSESNDLVFERHSLDDIIRQAVHKYAHEFVRRKLSFTCEPTDLQVLTDEKWLLFILEQVLSNALKYTQSDGIVIEVSEDAVLTVRDTGIGIAAEDLPRIFEKGYTGYNGRADKKSTGLGLYLCRRTAAMLGHRIWAESEAGAGTAIFLDLREQALGTAK